MIVFDDMPVRRSSNHIPSSPDGNGKTGIVTILGADFKPASIRRTLSADMSSKKWLQQNGLFSPTKQPQELDDNNKNPNQDEVWRSIQAQKETQKPPPQTGVWSMLLTQKSDSSLLNAPYVHPLVKRTNSSLSEKSLEVCTESLGSETGSDCFSCHSDGDEEREEVEQRSEKEDVQQRSNDDPFADVHVVKYKKSPTRPLPPPLPSIAGGLHVHSHREEGRLVLEAVSVAPRNFFNADRQNGRLRLTLKHAPANIEEELEEEKVQFMEAVDDDVEETVDRGGGGYSEAKIGGRKEDEFMVVEQENLSLPTGMISAHKSMKKLMAVGNINPKWSDDVAEFPIPQSLPPRPPSAARLAGAPASSFNAYEYFWRSKPGFTSTNSNSNKKKGNQELVAYMRRGCKEARRSLLREPYCIATS